MVVLNIQVPNWVKSALVLDVTALRTWDGPQREGGIHTASVNIKFIPFRDKLEARTLESHRLGTEGIHNRDLECHLRLSSR